MLDLSKIKAITLDLDDTLWPILPTIERCERLLHTWLQEQAPATALLLTDPHVRRELRETTAQQWPDLAHDLASLRREAIRMALQRAGDEPDLAEPAFAVFHAARMQVDLFEDARPGLASLAQRYPILALSNGSADVHQVGVGFDDVLADVVAGMRVGKQRRCHGRVVAQPVRERIFCTLDDRPDGPERVVQIKGDGADAGKVEHGQREYRMPLPSPFHPEPAHTHGQPARTAVLYCNLGTPDAPTAPALRRYLAEFLGDSRVVEIPKPIWWLILHGIILRVRPAKSAAKYASVWTPEGSPLMVWTRKQATLLQGHLGELGHRVEVRHAMTYGNPSVAQEMDKLKAEGFTRVLVLPAYPQYSGTTTAALFDQFYRWASRTRYVPELRFVNHYHDDPGYIAALAATVRKHWQANGQPDKLVMSFHGVPERTLHLGDPYHCECHKTGRLLAQALGLAKDKYVVTFQSRFGKAKWLEPYTEPTLVALAQAGTKKVDVICPGFTGDCLETLEEISMEAREAFLHAGGTTFNYIPCLNDSPDFIRALAQLTQAHLGGWPTQTTPDATELAACKERAVAMGAKQ